MRTTTEVISKLNKACPITLGSAAMNLVQQIEENGLRFDPSLIEHFQKDSEAITRLVVRGIIPSSAGKIAKNRLFRKIITHLESIKDNCI